MLNYLFLSCLIWLIISIWLYRRKHVSSLVLFINSIFVYGSGTLVIAYGDLVNIDLDGVLFSWACLVMVVMGSAIAKTLRMDKSRRSLISSKKIFCLLLVVLTITFITYELSTYFEGFSFSSKDRMEIWADGWKNNNIYTTFFSSLRVCGPILITVLLFERVFKLGVSYVIQILVCLGYVLLALGTGDRSYLLIIVSPYVSLFILSDKSLKSFLIWSFLFAVLAYFSLGYLNIFRWSDDKSLALLLDGEFLQRSLTFLMADKESDLFLINKMSWSFNTFPEKHDFIWFNTLLNNVLFFIPSRVVPDMRLDSMYLYSAIKNGAGSSPEKVIELVRGSYHPSFIGDIWANGGWLNIFYPFVFGFIIETAWKTSSFYRDSVLANTVAGYLPYVIFYCMRGSIQMPLFSVLLAVLVSLIVERISLILSWAIR